MSNIIELRKLNKSYNTGAGNIHVLKDLDLYIKKGEFLSIMGKSGSGKTTLLNILGLLDDFNSGEYIFNGEDITNFNEKRRSNFRNENIGFIFQQFHLIQSLDIYKNIELPLLYGSKKYDKSEIDRKIKEKLKEVGLIDKIHNRPFELSGGQQQRIAIARALITDAPLILADEPTGALDSRTSQEIMDLLVQLNNEGKTIAMVTHDPDLKKFTTRDIFLSDGEFIEGGI
ncbi:MAG: ABC transporter ATP-binding protein [Andreesenia angusta]|nr:ABC transporter ATP-binding protein [Andreesenia angusta]